MGWQKWNIKRKADLLATFSTTAATIFDFLTGDEKYKFRWAEAVKKNVNISFYRNTTDYNISRFHQFCRTALAAVKTHFC